MRLLLDESLPVQLRHHFVGHEVRTVRYMGWLSAGNGDLIVLARDEFDAIITCDKRMRYEQSLTSEDVAIVTLDVASKRYGRTSSRNSPRACRPNNARARTDHRRQSRIENRGDPQARKERPQ